MYGWMRDIPVLWRDNIRQDNGREGREFKISLISLLIYKRKIKLPVSKNFKSSKARTGCWIIRVIMSDMFFSTKKKCFKVGH